MLLEARNLHIGYGDAPAVWDVSLDVDGGEIVSVIGPNGAGKTTLINAIAGLLRCRRGDFRFDGRDMNRVRSHDYCGHGIALVPEGRRLFPSLTVEENLLMGANSKRPGPWNLQRLYTMFPVLEQKRREPATALSGGQQQMVAIGRALMSNPAVLLCDELSLGLAPIVIREIYAALPKIVAEGMTVVIVEQDVATAQQVSQRICCFQEGRVSLQGESGELTREQISAAYFGL
jgi:branched-chain amino acid transport system ATP-binding protein